ncbi:MAG: putative Type pilus assembly protein PilV [Deltaproteobacteria bacterium]|nr:putative Type pilus assembly protein PilV [Deltaproteobacteria bacterium]
MLNNKGFTLIEVLISVFLLSVGLLAVAAMQTTAMTGSTSSNNTTLSTQLAEEMVDRIRVNAGSTPNIYGNLNTGNCTGLGLIDPALGDCTQWRDRLQSSGLPGATGTVAVVTDSPISKTATVTVTVTWGLTGTRRTIVSTIIETWLT